MFRDTFGFRKSNASFQERVTFRFADYSGEPRFIQWKDYYYEELEKDGYSFFLQIDEEGYRTNMEYVFMYGALFLYKHNVTGNIIAGFWQYS